MFFFVAKTCPDRSLRAVSAGLDVVQFKKFIICVSKIRFCIDVLIFLCQEKLSCQEALGGCKEIF